MPRSALTVQAVTLAGAVESLAAANAAGNSIVNDGHVHIIVVNGSGSSINVTITPTTQKVGGMALTAPVIAVANGAKTRIGPFDPTWFNQSDGTVLIDYSAVTTVTVGAFSV